MMTRATPVLTLGMILIQFPLRADNTASDLCIQKNDANACLKAASELEGRPKTKATYKSIQAEMTELYRHGCDLKNNDCCRAYAFKLAFGGRLKEAIELFERLCNQGSRQSCQASAYWLDQEGRKDEARNRLIKECLDSKPSQSCEDLAKLTDRPEDHKLLKD